MESVHLLLATSNVHKLTEIRRMLPQGFVVSGLKEVGFTGDIAETGTVFLENALVKARHIHRIYGGNVIADDSGLEVDALNGRPGVFSARFAGQGASDPDNVEKLLQELGGQINRQARFVCVIILIFNGVEHVFEGVCEGVIAQTASGRQGFGYDPVFIPEGYNQTFADLPGEVKDRLSHRGKAVATLVDFLTVKSNKT